MTGDLKALQSLMGHSTASMTLDLYAHVLNDTLARAADVMAKGLADEADVKPENAAEPLRNSEGS
jgi:integrase